MKAQFISILYFFCQVSCNTIPQNTATVTPVTNLTSTRPSTSETTLSPNYNVLCPELFQDLVPNSEFCYMISKVANVSWGDADSECMEYDSRLTSIHNMEENDIITDLFRNESIDIWIGLQQNVQDDWKWVDGTPLDYSNWNETKTNATYYSNNVIFNCSKIDQSSGKWINTSCEELNGFVCKSKKRACSYQGINEQVAVNEGNDVARSTTLSLEECEILCDATRGCNSFAYAPPPMYDMINCYLKDKVITGSDETKLKQDWTTYYRQCGLPSNGTTTPIDDSTTTTPPPDKASKDRICPDGYFYSGDDTVKSSEGLNGYWPVSESPVYSCYKRISVDGINDGLEKCYTSTIADDMEARVVIFEDVEEVQRVFTHIMKHQPEDITTVPFLTSAMYFEDIQEWVYLGTNHNSFNVTETFGAIDRNDSTQQCLTVEGSHTSNYLEIKTHETFDLKWNSVKCNQQQTVLCEIRVETVTYAWVPNWMAFVLIILTITSLFSLCVAAMCITSRQPKSSKVKGANGRNTYPENDLPPKYNDIIVTQGGSFEKYKNKGKELFAKIYLVRE